MLAFFVAFALDFTQRIPILFAKRHRDREHKRVRGIQAADAETQNRIKHGERARSRGGGGSESKSGSGSGSGSGSVTSTQGADSGEWNGGPRGGTSSVPSVWSGWSWRLLSSPHHRWLLAGGGALLAVRLAMFGGGMPGFSHIRQNKLLSMAPLPRALTTLYVHAMNMALLFVPTTLSHDWGFEALPTVREVGDPLNVWTLAVFVAGALVLALSARGRVTSPSSLSSRMVWQWDIAVQCAVLVLVPLLPAMHIFMDVGFMVAERVLYLPSIGASLIIARALVAAAELVATRFAGWGSSSSSSSSSPSSSPSSASSSHASLDSGRTRRIRNALLQGAVGVILTFYARRTLERSSDYQSERTLYKSGVRDLPSNAGHHFNLARIDNGAGRKNAARRGCV